MKEIININALLFMAVMMFGSHKQTLNTKHVIAVGLDAGGVRKSKGGKNEFSY